MNLPAEAIAADHALSRRRKKPEPAEPSPAPDGYESWEAFSEHIAEVERRAEQKRRDRARQLVAAEAEVYQWAAVHARRDEIIRNALAAGVSVHRIHKMTGIARTTIARIAAKSEANR